MIQSIGMTGHCNIEKSVGKSLLMSGEIYNPEAFYEVYELMKRYVTQLIELNRIDMKTLTLVSGMARGADELFALLAMELNVGLILSIPASIKWHKYREPSKGIRSQAIEYDKILGYEKIIAINEIKKDYKGMEWNYVNFARNQNIVDCSNIMLAYKRYDSAGTDNCIKLAKESKKLVLFL